MPKITIKIFKGKNGKEPFTIWLESIKNKDTANRIITRLDRLECGNFGDTKAFGQNIYELRFHLKSGYRIYYGKEKTTIVILLCGGNKKTQSKDIQKAKKYWREYKEIMS